MCRKGIPPSDYLLLRVVRAHPRSLNSRITDPKQSQSWESGSLVSGLGEIFPEHAGHGIDPPSAQGLWLFVQPIRGLLCILGEVTMASDVSLRTRGRKKLRVLPEEEPSVGADFSVPRLGKFM